MVLACQMMLLGANELFIGFLKNLCLITFGEKNQELSKSNIGSVNLVILILEIGK